jgi:DNA-binding response OmpR family regulator
MEPSHTRILIVDDDDKMRLLLHDVLSDKGYETLEAIDGVEAIQVIQSEKPDLVILDIMMPRMSGFEVLRQLRHWSNLPVLVLSARGNLEDKTECLDLGADDYMTKPIEMKELLARVRAVLRRTAAERPLSGRSQFDDGYLRIDFDKR